MKSFSPKSQKTGLAAKLPKSEFRVRWCRERGEPKCSNPLDLSNRKVDENEASFQRAWKKRWSVLLASLPKPDLRAKDFRGASFIAAELEGADLTDTMLEGVDFTRAKLDGANLFGVNLEGATLTMARLEGTDLRESGLEGVNLEKSNLEGADLRAARLKGAEFTSSNIMGADLRDAELDGAYFGGVNLEGANLTASTLKGANFLRANLKGVNFTAASFEGVNIDGASLDGANMTIARLFGSPEVPLDLTVSNLGSVSIRTTALRNLILDSENLAEFRDFDFKLWRRQRHFASWGGASVSMECVGASKRRIFWALAWLAEIYGRRTECIGFQF